MPQAEFEEKEYENPLNIELLTNNNHNLWTPGQVFEEHFGIDAALYATHPNFWHLFGYPYSPGGVILNNFHWRRIWRQYGHRRQLPTFRTNLLLQTKRPFYGSRNNIKYAQVGINGRYWRFEKTDHQQKALEYLHYRLANRALICYSCAAFHTLTELYFHIQNQSLVDNSTFVKVHRLSNHNKWVYNRPGTFGLACSEIEKVEDKNFKENLKDLSMQNTSENSALQNLFDLEKAAIDVTYEIGHENPIAIEFDRMRQIISKGIDDKLTEIKVLPAVKAYLTFATFCDLTNSIWLSVGNE